MFEDADLIHRYSRADAIRDGALIDVSTTAREAGFKYPMALTAAAWAQCVAVPPGVACQDEAGRLWDVLTMLRFAIRGSAGGAGVPFGVHVRTNNRMPLLVRLKAVCAPGDRGNPSSPSCSHRRIETGCGAGDRPAARTLNGAGLLQHGNRDAHVTSRVLVS
jgi:hypothetical protein